MISGGNGPSFGSMGGPYGGAWRQGPVRRARSRRGSCQEGIAIPWTRPRRRPARPPRLNGAMASRASMLEESSHSSSRRQSLRAIRSVKASAYNQLYCRERRIFGRLLGIGQHDDDRIVGVHYPGFCEVNLRALLSRSPHSCHPDIHTFPFTDPCRRAHVFGAPMTSYPRRVSQ